MTKEVNDAVQHIEYSVGNFHSIDDIAWKFLIGQAILDKAKELGIVIEPSLIDAPEGEPRLFIDKAVIEVNCVHSIGEDDSSQNQQNSDSSET